jgi:hypothetical protein
MLRKVTYPLLATCAILFPLMATGAGASAPNAKTILTTALHNASEERSMTISGQFSESGSQATIEGGYAPAGAGGIESLSGEGTEDIIEPTGAKYCFVKATSLAVLKNALEVKTPTNAEIGVWYKVTSTDPRYNFIASPSGAQNIAQTFSFSSVGWSHAATYEGTTRIKGVRVIKLEGASNFWVTGKGFAKITLYVTDAAHSLPYAISGPPGTAGLVYFTKWNATTVIIPSSNVDLPE